MRTTATRVCKTCGHPDDHPDALQRVLIGDCVGCAHCYAAFLDACPRCGGDHDRVDQREPCPAPTTGAVSVRATYAFGDWPPAEVAVPAGTEAR